MSLLGFVLLAVQDRSLGDLVTHSLSHFCFQRLQSTEELSLTHVTLLTIDQIKIETKTLRLMGRRFNKKKDGDNKEEQSQKQKTVLLLLIRDMKVPSYHCTFLL